MGGNGTRRDTNGRGKITNKAKGENKKKITIKIK